MSFGSKHNSISATDKMMLPGEAFYRFEPDSSFWRCFLRALCK